MQFSILDQRPFGTGAGLGACCLSLLTVLNEKVFLPGSETYNGSLSSYFTQQESMLHPNCIVKPHTTVDVSSAIAVISEVAKSLPEQEQSQCHFAVRSGGHGINPGSANIAGGVTLDLGWLDHVVVSDGTAFVGPGATWDQVYQKLEPLGLAVAGGRSAGVGVGGLTTGGGLSFFSPRHGWTFDGVLSFEVVLANGSTVQASAGENSELLFALRGGSHNFGIVTSIAFRTFQQGPLWGGMNYYSLSTIDDHLKAFVDFASPETYDEYSSLITSFLLLSGQPPAIATNMEYTMARENPPALQALTAIPALQSTMRIANMSDLALELISVQPYGLRQLWVQVTLSSTLPMVKAAFRSWSNSLPSVRHVAGISWSLSLEPLPPCIYARGARSNALGLSNRSGSLIVTLLTASWSSAADDAEVTAAAKSLMAHIASEARRFGAYDEFVYLDYAAPWQDPIASYGVESIKRLQDVQREFDPEGLFIRNLPGGFKVPS